MLLADSLHPVASPAVDAFGNIFTTFSGSRGQKVPVAVFKIDLNFNVKPFINDLMNATAMVFDPDGMLYISSRYDGFVYQVTPNGNMSVYVEGMGVATGYLGAAPSVVWASGWFFAAAFVFLIPVAIWIYTLVFAFSSLWFAHYCLAALAQLRSAPVVPVPATPVALPDDRSSPT